MSRLQGALRAFPPRSIVTAAMMADRIPPDLHPGPDCAPRRAPARWGWPLSAISSIPTGVEAGAFGVRRRHHIHEGVDLHAPHGAEVFAVEDGRVAWCGAFTGPEVGTDWWLHTQALMVESVCGLVVYGEITPEKGLLLGTWVARGQRIGTVERVLRNDKGAPTAMLHLELRAAGHTELFDWPHGQEQPPWLLDPTPLLLGAARSRS